MDSSFVLEVTVAILQICVIGMLGWVSKILFTLWNDIKESHLRHGVTDEILSIRTGTRINSYRIAKGLDPFPIMTKK